MNFSSLKLKYLLCQSFKLQSLDSVIAKSAHISRQTLKSNIPFVVQWLGLNCHCNSINQFIERIMPNLRMSKFILLVLTLVNIVYICISIKAHGDNHSILPTHRFYTEILTTSTLFIKRGGQDTFTTLDICPSQQSIMKGPLIAMMENPGLQTFRY